MACKGKVCAECTRRCLSFHGKETNLASTITTSFFKIMIGTDYDEVMYLPPKFAYGVPGLVDKTAFLEDSSGQLWEVNVSYVNGSLAFHEGWNKFFLDHELKLGDFLVFNYIDGSHFVVRIYTNTACEKNDFPKSKRRKSSVTKKRNKRSRTMDRSSESSASIVSTSNVEITQIIGEANTKACDKSHSLPVVKHFEEPCHIIDRDLEKKQGENRRTISDLSAMEMLTNNCSAHNGKDMLIRQADDLPKSHADATISGKNTEFKMVDNTALFSDKRSCDLSNMVQPLCRTVSECGKYKNSNQVFRSGHITQNQDESEFHKVMNADVLPKSHVEVNLSDTNAVSKMVGNHAEANLRDKNAKFKMVDNIASASNKHSLNVVSMVQPLRRTVLECAKHENSNGYITQNQVRAESEVIKSEIGNAGLKVKRELESVVPFTTSTLDCQKHVTPKLESDIPFTNEMLNVLGDNRKTVKEELIEMTGNTLQIDKVGWEQKSNLKIGENIARLSLKMRSQKCISCVITSTDEPYLELPSCLPYVRFPGRNKNRGNTVIFLRDPHMRTWPVIYIDRSAFKLLSSGWEEFRDANNIKAGDECLFSAAYNSELTCEVSITRR